MTTPGRPATAQCPILRASHSGKLHLGGKGESVGYGLGHRHLTPKVQLFSESRKTYGVQGYQVRSRRCHTVRQCWHPAPATQRQLAAPASHVTKGSSPKGPIRFSAKPDSALHLEGFCFPQESRGATRAMPRVLRCMQKGGTADY